MPIDVRCSNPACDRRYRVPEGAAGKSVRCKACGETFVAAGKTEAADDFIEPAWEPAAPGTPRGAAQSAFVPVGGTVGRFVTRAKVGSGAFGTVYLAYDPQLDRVVALKVPNPGVMDTPRRVERFLREAKAAAGLRHPHIVPVFDAGQDGDRYYIATAFIDGGRLADAVPESGMELPRAVRLARELAEALAYAHAEGIVHRDVKPQNVMLDKQDRVHLMDFGLASRLEEEARLTSDGAVMGTPAYMSPEQARGQQGEARPATDQYAAGVVLYELLTGRVPFSGPTPVVLHNVIHAEPEPPSKHRPEVPKDLETACLKAMAKRPEDRYAGCQEFADDLRRWLEGEPVSARRLRPWERAGRWVRKEPKLAAALAAVALVLVASVVVVSEFARRTDAARRDAEGALARIKESEADARAAEERERAAADQTFGALDTAAGERKRAKEFADRAEQERKTAAALHSEAEGQRKRAESLEAKVEEERKRAETSLWVRWLAEGRALQAAYDAAQAGKLEEARSALRAVPPGQRGWEWRHLRLRCEPKAGAAAAETTRQLRGSPFRLLSQPASVREVTDDGDGLRVWDVTTGEQVAFLRGGDDWRHYNSNAAFDRGGKLIVTLPRVVFGNAAGSAARVWDLTTGKQLHALQLKASAAPVTFAAFDPGGERLAAAAGDGTVRLLKIGSGEESVLRGHTGRVTDGAFSPDGSRLVTVARGQNSPPRVWDVGGGKELCQLKGVRDDVNGAAFNSDGSRVILTTTRGVGVWDAGTGEAVRAVAGGVGSTRWLSHGLAALSPDGKQFVLRDGSAVLVCDSGTAEPVRKVTPPGTLQHAGFSPDGRWLIAIVSEGRDYNHQTTVLVWDAKTGKEFLSLPEHKYHSGAVNYVALSPDGTRVVTAGSDRVVRLWDTSGGRLTVSMRQRWPVYSLHWSMDGSKVSVVSQTPDGHTVTVLDGGPPDNGPPLPGDPVP